MALELGIDTYITEAAAAAYYDAYGPDGAAEQVTEQHLLRATLAIDRLFGARFIGVSTMADQPLLFPVNGATRIPTPLAHATAELAYLLSQDVDPYVVPDPVVTEVTVEVPGAIKESKKYGSVQAADPLHRVALILAPLLRQASVGGITFVDVVAG